MRFRQEIRLPAQHGHTYEVEENVVVYPEPKTDWDSRGEVWELDADTVTPPASDAWASDRSDYSSELNSEASTVEHRPCPGPGFTLVN